MPSARRREEREILHNKLARAPGPRLNKSGSRAVWLVMGAVFAFAGFALWYGDPEAESASTDELSSKAPEVLIPQHVRMALEQLSGLQAAWGAYRIAASTDAPVAAASTDRLHASIIAPKRILEARDNLRLALELAREQVKLSPRPAYRTERFSADWTALQSGMDELDSLIEQTMREVASRADDWAVRAECADGLAGLVQREREDQAYMMAHGDRDSSIELSLDKVERARACDEARQRAAQPAASPAAV